MDNPVATIKSNLTPGKLIGFTIVAFAVFAILDATNLTNWILYPVTTARAKFAKQS